MKPIPPRHQPPSWANRLLQWYCDDSLLEEVEGDLHERFCQRIQRQGVRRARLFYAWDVLRSFPLAFVQRKPVHSISTPSLSSLPISALLSALSMSMLGNYFSVSGRSLWKNKFSSMVSIIGLAFGLAASLLIGLWTARQISMDSFHENVRRTYYVMERQFYSDGTITVYNGSAGLLSQQLGRQIPELAFSCPFTGWTDKLAFRFGNRLGKESGHYAGKDFLTMFSYPLLLGDVQTALSEPTSMAISRKLAGKYFGSPHAAIGKIIRVENRKDYQVSAVFEDVPFNSSVQFDFLLPYQAFLQENEWALDWEKNPVTTFIRLRSDADAAKVEAKLKSFLKTYRHQTKTELFLQRYDQAYLHSHFTNGQPDGGRIDYVRMLAISSLLILLIACINFTNLATAQASKRAKEVGVRKVMGASRPVLMGQFLCESLVVTLAASLLAVVMTGLLLPGFNYITGTHIELDLSDRGLWVGLGSLTLATSLLAGCYPALFLASLKPVAVLKGILRFSPWSRLFRKGLVVVQFVFSLVLVVGTVLIYRQVQYLQAKHSGFDREHLIYLPLQGRLAQQHQLLTRQLTNLPAIAGVTLLSQPPTSIDNGVIEVDWPGKNPQQKTLFTQVGVGYDLVSTLKLTLTRGRDFSPGLASDSAGYLINESAARVMGLTDPIGQSLSLWGYKGRIIGVLKDFHFESLHNRIEPLIVYLQGQELQAGSKLVIRIKQDQPGQQGLISSQIPALLKAIQVHTQRIEPAFPFEYEFARQQYQKEYRNEQTAGVLSGYFAVLSLLLTGMGILGLVVFMAEQRRKEIGIRKVLGASTGSIVLLFYTEFAKLIVLASFVATPIVWYATHKWLQGFAYRQNIGWSIFVISGFGAMLITLLTISIKAMQAAQANPVKSLRSD